MLKRVLRVFAAAKVLLARQHFDFAECIISARPEEFPLIEKIDATEKLPFTIRLVEGGQTRQQSVHNAVQVAGSDWVLIHDAARPLLSPQLIISVCEAAHYHGAAIAAILATDTIKYATADAGQPFIKSTFERNRVWLAQTPQVFPRQLFNQALQSALQAGFEATDCASLVERLGQKVALVPGEADNFKITYAQDLARAEHILKERRG